MKSISKIILALTLFVALPGRGQTPDKAPAEVKVELYWNYKDFPLKVKMYELASQALSQTGMVSNRASFKKKQPILREISDHTVRVTANFYKMVLLEVENPTAEDIYFYAVPHETIPAEKSLGLKFLCLCFGDVFRVPAKGVWYRVVQVKILSSNRNDAFKLTHDIYKSDLKKLPSPDDDPT